MWQGIRVSPPAKRANHGRGRSVGHQCRHKDCTFTAPDLAMVRQHEKALYHDPSGKEDQRCTNYAQCGVIASDLNVHGDGAPAGGVVHAHA